jgi:hypothetical protein
MMGVRKAGPVAEMTMAALLMAKEVDFLMEAVLAFLRA